MSYDRHDPELYDLRSAREQQMDDRARGMHPSDPARPAWVDEELQAEHAARVDAITDAINCHTPPTFMEFADSILEAGIDTPDFAALLAAVIYPQPATEDAPSSQDAARALCDRWIQRYAEERA